MLTYKALYKFLNQGVHAEVLDFPGAITCGPTLEEARRLLASALADMAETNLLRGEPLPPPELRFPNSQPHEFASNLVSRSPHERVFRSLRTFSVPSRSNCISSVITTPYSCRAVSLE